MPPPHRGAITGIVVALAAEAAAFSPPPSAGVAQLASHRLLLLSGVGPRRARAAAERLLAAGAGALLSWGTAAGLDPILAPGALLLPAAVLAADGRAYPVHSGWRESLYRRLTLHCQVHSGLLAESPALLTDPQEKSVLFGRSGALAVDMESAAVGAAALAAGVPFVVVRAVADPAAAALPRAVADALTASGQVYGPRLLYALARRPADLVALARLARQFHAASRALRSVRAAADDLLQPPGIQGSGA